MSVQILFFALVVLITFNHTLSESGISIPFFESASIHTICPFGRNMQCQSRDEIQSGEILLFAAKMTFLPRLPVDSIRFTVITQLLKRDWSPHNILAQGFTQKQGSLLTVRAIFYNSFTIPWFSESPVSEHPRFPCLRLRKDDSHIPILPERKKGIR